MSFVVEPVVVAVSVYSSRCARESGLCFAASGLFATQFLGVAFVESCFVGYC